MNKTIHTMAKGIVMIAGGDWHYGKMARNLAMGIRRWSDIEIALFTDEVGRSHLTPFDKSFFTLYDLPAFAYKRTNNTDSFYRAKTLLNELTPFEETVYLDVDIIWHPNRIAEELFNVDGDFTMTNEGYIDFKTGENTIARNYHFWSKPDNVRRAYPETVHSRLYQLRSEYIYWKKSEANDKYFSLARKIYDFPKMETLRFGDVMPDEAAFDVASAILKHYPVKSGYSPIYWDYLYAFLRIGDVDARKELYSRYYASSMGGKYVREVQKILYNQLLNNNFSHYKITPDYQWSEKIDFAKHHQLAIK